MKPGEIYRVEKNEFATFDDIKYVKFKNIRKDENEFTFTLTTLNKKNEKQEAVISGEDVFTLISDGKLQPATDTDKAKLVLGQKGF